MQGPEPLRPSSSAVGLGLFILVTACVSALHASGLVGLNALAASPHRVFSGQVWLLVTSGLLVQKPLALSLVSFAALGGVTLVLCRWRVLALVGVIGHVASTVLVYGLLALMRSAVHGAFASVWLARDYGVSAISAAWLGALASIAWRRRGNGFVQKMPVLLGCAAIVAFSLIVHRNVNMLDSEHLVAFLAGVGISWRAVPVTAASIRPLLRTGSTRRAAIAVAAVLVALSGASLAEAVRSLTAPDLPVAQLAAAAQGLAVAIGDPAVEHADVVLVRTTFAGNLPLASFRAGGERQVKHYLIVLRGRFACLRCSPPVARPKSLASVAAAIWIPDHGLKGISLSRRPPSAIKRLGKLTSIRLP